MPNCRNHFVQVKGTHCLNKLVPYDEYLIQNKISSHRKKSHWPRYGNAPLGREVKERDKEGWRKAKKKLIETYVRLLNLQ